MSVGLAQIVVYPLKSARGIAVDAWEVGPRGLVSDRSWMVVGPDGVFLTMRELPQMALIDVALDGAGLDLAAPGMPRLAVAPPDTTARRVVRVWKDDVEAVPAGDAADAWLTLFLGRPCALVRFADEARRQVDPTYARPGDEVGFADGFSLLLAGEASLAAVNERLATPVPMSRFRPNLVVAGAGAFAEDGWKRIRVGAIELDVVKPCGRCSIVTVDRERGEAAKEPLATLATFRRVGNGVLFGQNLVHRGRGRIRVGDPVVVLA